MAPKLNAFGLIVADMGKSLDFYRRLGVDIPAGAETEGHVDAELGGGIRLMWDTVEVIRSFDPHWQPTQGSGPIGLAFECADPAEVDRVHDELVAAGHHSHKAPWDAVWGQRYAIVNDPDGNEVSLYAALTAAG